ncbi:hypothetical protein HT585_25885 [Ensifer sp. HO-A22]|uniref:Uncharacterized protein n=1 Tax=Ensifer oleiphilus TaxID=2742698 RepID=A0A7Y6QAX6_9HYPH|nr:hypothetical protein [Ensifer oleiphilus]NVD42305.1 hypothetical protein [Ensifer oleiphilus]
MLNDQFIMPHMASDCGYFKPWNNIVYIAASGHERETATKSAPYGH